MKKNEFDFLKIKLSSILRQVKKNENIENETDFKKSLFEKDMSYSDFEEKIRNPMKLAKKDLKKMLKKYGFDCNEIVKEMPVNEKNKQKGINDFLDKLIIFKTPENYIEFETNKKFMKPLICVHCNKGYRSGEANYTKGKIHKKIYINKNMFFYLHELEKGLESTAMQDFLIRELYGISSTSDDFLARQMNFLFMDEFTDANDTIILLLSLKYGIVTIKKQSHENFEKDLDFIRNKKYKTITEEEETKAWSDLTYKALRLSIQLFYKLEEKLINENSDNFKKIKTLLKEEIKNDNFKNFFNMMGKEITNQKINEIIGIKERILKEKYIPEKVGRFMHLNSILTSEKVLEYYEHGSVVDELNRHMIIYAYYSDCLAHIKDTINIYNDVKKLREKPEVITDDILEYLKAVKITNKVFAKQLEENIKKSGLKNYIIDSNKKLNLFFYEASKENSKNYTTSYDGETQKYGTNSCYGYERQKNDHLINYGIKESKIYIKAILTKLILGEEKYNEYITILELYMELLKKSRNRISDINNIFYYFNTLNKEIFTKK